MAINFGNKYTTFTSTGHKPYDDFINKYGIRSINVSRGDYRNIDYYNTKASYYADREEMFDIEMNRHSFENLVEMDRYAQETYQKQRYEAGLRNQHPAIKEAYEKYRMLLELYR